jgi:sodium/hydrogen exchanger 8
VFFGGSTLPLLKFLQPGKKNRRLSQGRSSHGRSGIRSQQKEKTVSLSKTKEFGQAIDSEHLSHSELTEEEEVQFSGGRLGGFARLDRKYFIPFFTRIFSNQVRDVEVNKENCCKSFKTSSHLQTIGTSRLQKSDC